MNSRGQHVLRHGILTDALAYVSGVLGIMLGLLLFFSVEVYEDASSSARDEALALVNVYESADYFPRPKPTTCVAERCV